MGQSGGEPYLVSRFMEKYTKFSYKDQPKMCYYSSKELLPLSSNGNYKGENMENITNDKCCMVKDVEAVVTSFNQGAMILEAVRSLCRQTMPPARIIIVDDGSTDEDSINILDRIKTDSNYTLPITVVRQPNGGVSAARNTGISRSQAALVLVLDGDDMVEPSYIEEVSRLLQNDASMVASSSWMHTFGALDSTVCPGGGSITEFLARNCCPATHILRREAWEACGGYDESLRSGFEDWDFFLSILETKENAQIGIVPKPLIDYRTAPASLNVRSMSKRLELMHLLIEKHSQSYHNHIADAILGIEAISMSRLHGWESQILHTLEKGQSLSKESDEFVMSPTYGDGGMAAAVRIASGHHK